MAKKLGLCIVVVGLLLDATTSRAADKIRVAFPSLATALSPSWITADKGMWRKYGLEVELIYLDGGARSVAALIGAARN